MPENPLDGQPFVKLRHPGLNRETTQPLSYAKNLVRDSGWQPADEAAARLLGVDFPTKKERKAPQQSAASTEKGD